MITLYMDRRTDLFASRFTSLITTQDLSNWFFLCYQDSVENVYIERGQVQRHDQNDNIHYLFLFVQRMYNSMQYQPLTKSSQVEKIHGIV
jgi:hypothetical protein